VHPGMPTPTLSGPSVAQQSAALVTPSAPSAPRGLFSGLFDSKPSAPAPASSQVASADTGSQQNSGFFGNLFKPKKEAVQQADATDAQGAALSGLRPSQDARKAEAQKNSPPKSEPQQKAQPQKSDPQVADAPRPKTAKPQQDANAAPPAANNGLIKGAQPVMPSGSFEGRWAGLQ
jgi:hypothetical protein